MSERRARPFPRCSSVARSASDDSHGPRNRCFEVKVWGFLTDQECRGQRFDIGQVSRSGDARDIPPHQARHFGKVPDQGFGDLVYRRVQNACRKAALRRVGRQHCFRVNRGGGHHRQSQNQSFHCQSAVVGNLGRHSAGPGLPRQGGAA